MPRANKRKKSKKLKQLEDKLKIIQKEIARREKRNAASVSLSPVKTTKRRKSSKTVFAECQALLDRIKRITYSKPFLLPVDWKALNIPKYPQIIKKPMDLQTVQTRLNNSSYATPYDFAKDMRLIYQNSQTFNKPNTAYYISSQKFAKKFEEEFEKKIVDAHESNDFTRRIHKVMSSLIKRDDSMAFRAPVNPKALDIPDYLDVIEEPMDLGTILNKIHKYSLFKNFCADLYLVWDNCCRYNPKQNMIHQTALRLRDYTTKQLGRLCSSDYEIWKDDDEQSPTPYDPSSLLMTGQTKQSAKEQKAETETIQSHESVIKPMALEQNLFGDDDEEEDNDVHMESVNDDDDEEDDSLPDIFNRCDEIEDEDERNRIMIDHLMKKEELNPEIVFNLDLVQKEELQRGILCLDSDHFDPLVNMLQSFIPDGENEDDEVELDVDSIDDSLQVKMYNYMLQAIQQQETERIQREGGNAQTQQPQENKQETHGQPQEQQQQPQAEQQQLQQNENGNEEEEQQQQEQESPVQAQMMEVEQQPENAQQAQQEEAVENAPNMSNAFPMSTTEPIQSNDNEAENNNQNEQNVDANNQKQDYANLFGQEESEQNEENQNENERSNNVDVEMETRVNNDADDIIADIANVIATENDKTPSVDPSVNISDTMPVMPTNEVENNENKEEMNVDNNQEEAQGTEQQKGANEESAVVETDEIVPTLPNMPSLQTADDVENDQKNEEAKTGSNEMNDEINPIEAEKQLNKRMEELSANVDESTNDQVEADDEDEDVDTPLADDIEF